MVPVIRNRSWMPNWLDDFFGDEWPAGRSSQYATPSVNIIESERCFCIEVAAPGMTKEDFCINLAEGNELVVSLEKCSECGKPAEGEHKHEHKEREKDKENEKSRENKTYLRREFSYGSFRRTFILPEIVDKSKISATMKNGVLSIELPKREESKQTPTVRQIAIE